MQLHYWHEYNTFLPKQSLSVCLSFNSLYNTNTKCALSIFLSLNRCFSSASFLLYHVFLNFSCKARKLSDPCYKSTHAVTNTQTSITEPLEGSYNRTRNGEASLQIRANECHTASVRIKSLQILYS